jgi:hypothetical protein
MLSTESRRTVGVWRIRSRASTRSAVSECRVTAQSPPKISRRYEREVTSTGDTAKKSIAARIRNKWSYPASTGIEAGHARRTIGTSDATTISPGCPGSTLANSQQPGTSPKLTIYPPRAAHANDRKPQNPTSL